MLTNSVQSKCSNAFPVVAVAALGILERDVFDEMIVLQLPADREGIFLARYLLFAYKVPDYM